jgi:hypothetical protein
MCCGQNRTALRNSQSQVTTRTVPQYNSGNSQVQAVRTQLPSRSASPTASPRPPVSTPSGSDQRQAPTPVSTPQPTINVRYLERSPIRVRGLVSGRSYEFSGTAPVQPVDARDATSFLNTRFFRRAS